MATKKHALYTSAPDKVDPGQVALDQTWNFQPSTLQIDGNPVKPAMLADVVSLANISLSGVGQSIDGVTITAGMKVLVVAQSTTSNNGVWTAASGSWSRVLDGMAADSAGRIVVVSQGTAKAGSSWVLSGFGAFVQIQASGPAGDTTFQADTAATTNQATTGTGQTINGYVVGVGSKVLLTAQNSSSENGVWTAASGSWAKTVDGSAATNAGKTIGIVNGSLAGTSWIMAAISSIVQLGTLPLLQAAAIATTNQTASGVGQTIDGVVIAAGQRVLLASQASPSDNGIYIAASGSWTKVFDLGNAGNSGRIIGVTGGSLYAGTNWVMAGTGTVVRLGAMSTYLADLVATGSVALTGVGQTIDGVASQAGMRVLVTAQSPNTNNGVWRVENGAWTRILDNGLPNVGKIVGIQNGSTYYGTAWTMAGTTFVRVGGASGGTSPADGTTIVDTGTAISVGASSLTNTHVQGGIEVMPGLPCVSWLYFHANPANGETARLQIVGGQDKTYEFRSGGSPSGSNIAVTIGVSAAATANNLQLAIAGNQSDVQALIRTDVVEVRVANVDRIAAGALLTASATAASIEVRNYANGLNRGTYGAVARTLTVENSDTGRGRIWLPFGGQIIISAVFQVRRSGKVVACDATLEIGTNDISIVNSGATTPYQLADTITVFAFCRF